VPRLAPLPPLLPKIIATGGHTKPWNDLYHWLLQLHWLAFAVAGASIYLWVNFVFATLYWLSPGSLRGVSAHSFEQCFYFSVQTLATIGYGNIAPASRYAHVLVTLEAFTGIASTALITGLTFAKFSKPSARVIFTRKMIIRPRDGVPTLCFRMANSRQNTIAEAVVRFILLVREETAEGEVLRVPIDVKLVRASTATFILSWTAMHIIDETSPFYGEAAMALLEAKEAEMFVVVTGIDETVGQTIHARTRFRLADIVENARFADIISIDASGTRRIDYRKFHDVVELEPKQS
jgi:inward rectifier potassium channel